MWVTSECCPLSCSIDMHHSEVRNTKVQFRISDCAMLRAYFLL
jgi:hypothetical protein